MLRKITLTTIILAMAVPALAADICQQKYRYAHDMVNDIGNDNEFVVCEKCQEPVKVPPPVKAPSVLAVSHLSPATPSFEQNDYKGSVSIGGPGAAESNERIGVIHFNLNSSAIDSNGKQELESVVSILKAGTEGKRIIATGFTCDLGSKKYNDRLAVKRVNKVSKFLASRNIHLSEATGKGKTGYLTTDKAKRRLNRRVEVTVSSVANTHIKSTKGGQDHD